MLARIRRCFWFWWKSISSSKEVFDKIIWGLTVSVWLAVLLQELAVFPSISSQVFSQSEVEKLTWIIAILLTLRAIVWLPFCRYEKVSAELQAIKEETKPLEITVENRVLNTNVWKKVVEIVIKNPNLTKVAENVSVKLLKMEPPMTHRTDENITTENCGMFPVNCLAQLPDSNSINAGQTARFEVLSLAAGALYLEAGRGPKNNVIAAFPPGSDFLFCSPALAKNEFEKYRLTIEATAKNRARNEAQFRLTVSTDVDELFFSLVKV